MRDHDEYTQKLEYPHLHSLVEGMCAISFVGKNDHGVKDQVEVLDIDRPILTRPMS